MVVLFLKAAIPLVHAHGQEDKDPSSAGLQEQGDRPENAADSAAGDDTPPAFPPQSQPVPSDPDRLKPPQGAPIEQQDEALVPDAGEFNPPLAPHNGIVQAGPERENFLREVRETYFSGNFDEAEELLARYGITGNRGNPEIIYWLTLVRGARALRSGRIIPITAPLYAEMSQLLSDAKKSYDEGLLFITTNQRNAALTKLTEARQKTQQVRLLFPVNEEADFLELRIDQIADPSTFNRSFRRRLDKALAGIRNRSLEAFADLQNLARINPQYPGMGEILEQAELDMGYRPPPPNPQDLAQSDELTAMAQNMVYPKDRNLYPFALELLNQALQLNPHNDQAMAIKDQIQTSIGGAETIVLDAAAEADYQRAVRALQQGNPITALSILRQLLQNPRYRNSAKIIALQRRIESAL